MDSKPNFPNEKNYWKGVEQLLVVGSTYAWENFCKTYSTLTWGEENNKTNEQLHIISNEDDGMIWDDE